MKIIIAFCALVLVACNNSNSPNAANGKDSTNVNDTVAGVPNSKSADTSTTIIDMHKAENALDVFGKYTGTLPCADCEGIKTILELKDDNSFILAEEYLGKKNNKFTAKGQWKIKGDKMTMQFSGSEKDRVLQYRVEENRLKQLDQEGKVITGDLADKYVLTKVK